MHRTPASRAPAHTRESSVIIGDQYWTFSGTGTSTNAACGCFLVSRGNVTHGLAVVGLLLDQIIREGDGDTVLSTRIKVLQNLSVQKFNVLEENGGNGENDQRMPSFHLCLNWLIQNLRVLHTVGADPQTVAQRLI